jgi:hypothetical protein
MPRDSSAPPTAAPTIPPTLNMPCNEDMIGRPSVCSTALASAFIATSSVAIPAPKTARTASSIQYRGTIRINAAQTAIARPPARHARRVPTRAIHEALVAIAVIEPPATASKAIDSSAGFRWKRSRTVGTCTPQDAYIIPAIKKSAIVAYRARCSEAAGRSRWAAGSPERSEERSDKEVSLA